MTCHYVQQNTELSAVGIKLIFVLFSHVEFV